MKVADRMGIVASCLAALLATSDSRAEAVQKDVRSQSAELPSNIRIRTEKGRSFYTDRSGKTLYFGTTEEGLSCGGYCAERWQPLVIKAGDKASQPFASWRSPEGYDQWSLNGRPLFTYSKDRRAGDKLGLVEGIWVIAEVTRPVPVIIIPTVVQIVRLTPQTLVLANRQGRSLYFNSRDRLGRPVTCDASCLFEWEPVAASMLARPIGDWTIIHRPDGARQWAFRGKPLYVPLGDEPGPNGVWRREEL